MAKFSTYTNREDLLQAIDNLKVEHIKLTTAPQLDRTNENWFSITGLKRQFNIGKLGRMYIAYRIFDEMTSIIEIERNDNQVEVAGVDETLRNPDITLEYVNYALSLVFKNGCTLAFVGEELVAIMDADYVSIPHTQVADMLYNLDFANVSKGRLTKSELVLVIPVLTINEISLNLHVVNGVAGTVAFGYRLYVSSDEWEAPAPKFDRSRHLDSKVDRISEVVTNLKATVEAMREESYLTTLLGHTISQSSVIVKTDKEIELLAEVFAGQAVETALTLITRLSAKAGIRGYKTAATSLIKRITSEVNFG